MKTENIYRNTNIMHITMEAELSLHLYNICGEASALLYVEEQRKEEEKKKLYIRV